MPKLPRVSGAEVVSALAMWNAEVNRNGGLAHDHYKGMQDIGPEACGPELAYVKKFGR
jgi:hypothetical protein